MLRALESADCEGFPGIGAFRSRHPGFRASEEAVPGPVSALRWLALSGALLSAMYSYDVAQVTAQRPVQAVEGLLGGTLPEAKLEGACSLTPLAGVTGCDPLLALPCPCSFRYHWQV